MHTVDTGKVAVVKNLGKIKTVREAGTYYDFWMTNKYVKYDTKVQEVNIEDMAYSSDAQQMTLNIKFQYQIMPDKVKEITSKYGKLSSLEARIQPIVIEKVKSMLSKHTAMNIIANRSQLSPDAEELVKGALGEEYYINVVSVSLTNIDFSDQFETAVEDKMIAEQAKLKADYENETKIAKAEADAKAKIVEAEASAKANDLLERSLTDKILKEMYIKKWDGKLPQVVSHGDTIMQLPEIK
jgi:regulator of protease activity HflC (stomatin/prohibitin superfamily)